MFEWFDRVGYDADMPLCAAIFRRFVGTVLRTGRASLTRPFLSGRLLPPEVATRNDRRTKSGELQPQS
jgi:hypothetical protein